MVETSLCMAPWHCPECGIANYGVPRCRKCGWVDPKWESYEKEMVEFWKKPHLVVNLQGGKVNV